MYRAAPRRRLQLTAQLDIICDTAFGLKANSLEKGHELAEAYEQLIDLQSGQVSPVVLADRRRAPLT